MLKGTCLIKRSSINACTCIHYINRYLCVSMETNTIVPRDYFRVNWSTSDSGEAGHQKAKPTANVLIVPRIADEKNKSISATC